MTSPSLQPKVSWHPARRGSVPSPREQRGVALLVAILLVALGTIIAAAMAYNNAMTARRAGATFAFDQALLVAQGAEALAAYGLQQQVQHQEGTPYIGPNQPWATPFGPAEVTPGVTLEAHLEDLQGRFNVNDLVGTDGNTPNMTAIGAFQRLLTMLNINTNLAYYIVDWIDQNTTPMSPEGAEDSVYMEMNPPYRTANRFITSTSELMALPGLTRAQFDRLAPHIVALPPGTPINVCSADQYVLDALMGVQQFTADSEFAQNRATYGGCFPPLNSVKVAPPPTGTANPVPNVSTQNNQNNPNPPANPNNPSLIGTTSSWFRLTSFVSLGSTEFAVYTLLYQDGTSGTVRPVMRSFTPD